MGQKQPPCLPLWLPPELYTRLERQAQAQERDPLQQARWLLRQALVSPPGAEPTAPVAVAPQDGGDDAV